MGISVKRFHGWEPETVYVYDGDRLVSSRPEPEWDDREQALALALQAYKDSLCPMCGLPFEVCTAAENEGKFKVEGPVRCHKSTALSVASSKLDPKIPHSESLLFGASLAPS